MAEHVATPKYQRQWGEWLAVCETCGWLGDYLKSKSASEGDARRHERMNLETSYD
jgi:hypothetical protein